MRTSVYTKVMTNDSNAQPALLTLQLPVAETTLFLQPVPMYTIRRGAVARTRLQKLTHSLAINSVLGGDLVVMVLNCAPNRLGFELDRCGCVFEGGENARRPCTVLRVPFKHSETIH